MYVLRIEKKNYIILRKLYVNQLIGLLKNVIGLYITVFKFDSYIKRVIKFCLNWLF